MRSFLFRPLVALILPAAFVGFAGNLMLLAGQFAPERLSISAQRHALENRSKELDADREEIGTRLAQATVDNHPHAPHVAVVYSKKYQINLAGLERLHPFDIHKYSKIYNRLVADGILAAGEAHVPNELTREQILMVHTPAFLDSLKNPKTLARYLEAPVVGRLPAALLDRGMLRAFRRASGGTLLAARLALKHGIAVNIGGGYHHAKPGKGEGFCIYADMPITVKVLQKENLVRRVLIVDLDVHQGNGTIVCCRNDPNVYTFSMHQGTIYPHPKEKGSRDIELDAGTTDEEYLRILRKALPEVIAKSKPDLVILQAGCDTLKGDPLASLAMTQKGIVIRDAYVVDTCARRAIPVVMTTGGGYSKEAWKVQHASIANLLAKYGVVAGPGGSQKPVHKPITKPKKKSETKRAAPSKFRLFKFR